jgi:hypothetical protein
MVNTGYKVAAMLPAGMSASKKRVTRCATCLLAMASTCGINLKLTIVMRSLVIGLYGT